MKEELVKFTTQQLKEEVSRREEEAKELAKDRSKRTYYKQVEASTVKEKAKFLKDNPDADIKEEDGELYAESVETDEELATRLSRTAHASEDYDQAVCDYYEDGIKVGMTTHEMPSSAEWSAKNWENDKGCWDEDCDFPTRNRWFPLEFNAQWEYVY